MESKLNSLTSLFFQSSYLLVDCIGIVFVYISAFFYISYSSNLSSLRILNLCKVASVGKLFTSGWKHYWCFPLPFNGRRAHVLLPKFLLSDTLFCTLYSKTTWTKGLLLWYIVHCDGAHANLWTVTILIILRDFSLRI